MLEWFKCLDGQITPVKDCLTQCRLEERCLTLPTLTMIAQEREWTGTASTTQLLNGTMYSFLKLTQPYTIDPDKMAFALLGTKHHADLAEVAKRLGLPAEIPLSIDRDIFDLLEPEDGSWTLTDLKTWGSFRVAKVLGIVKVGKKPDPSGEVYKKAGPWGQVGTPKMVDAFALMSERAENWETELQLNRYRVMLEERGIQVGRMQIQITVRDGGLAVARSRGVERNTYMVPVKRLEDDYVNAYFENKAHNLEIALGSGKYDTPCNDQECWDGRRCEDYCEVAMYCTKGLLYQREE